MGTKLTKQDFGLVISTVPSDPIRIIRYKDTYQFRGYERDYAGMVKLITSEYKDDFSGDLKYHLVALEKLKTINIGDFNIHAGDDHAVYWAVIKNDIPLINLLIKHGADVCAGDNQMLVHVSRNNYPKIVKLLLKHGADANAGKEYSNPIYVAKLLGHRYIVFLLKKSLIIKKISNWINKITGGK